MARVEASDLVSAKVTITCQKCGLQCKAHPDYAAALALDGATFDHRCGSRRVTWTAIEADTLLTRLVVAGVVTESELDDLAERIVVERAL